MSNARISPPALFFSCILAMEGVFIITPGPRFVSAPLAWGGILPILLGIWLHSQATGTFRRNRTTVATLASPRVLVTGWPFSRTRNPMYLAGVSILLGIGVILGTVAPMFLPPLFALLAHRWFIRPEEALLEAEFGEEYRGYAERVRPWI